MIEILEYTGIVLFILFFIMIIVNIYLNEFGLFGNVKNKRYRVFRDERTSKNLFSYNYIPQNFNGVLIGPSLSDIEVDTQKIDNYDVYNLSVNGANISELQLLVNNILKYGDIKLFIICLDPYITQDNGLKTGSINKKEYYFSFLHPKFLYKYYKKKFERIKSPKDDIYQDSYWGYRHNDNKDGLPSTTQEIDDFLKTLKKEDQFRCPIDDIAYTQLTEVLKNVRDKGIQIVAYYHPLPKRFFEQYYHQESYGKYRKEIDKLLNYDHDIVIDFFEDQYDYLRDDDSNFSGVAHLTQIGGDKVIAVLNEKLKGVS